MARKFSYEAVTTLAEGEACAVHDYVSTVKRKVALYGARNGKRFDVRNTTPPETLAIETTVTRLPVTDSELPGA